MSLNYYSAVTKTLKRFNGTEHFKERIRVESLKTITNDEWSLNVILDLVENPETLLSQIA